MIRFIATDLDGTLLDPQGRLPGGIFPLAERLSARGILFAPASGRQYANLRQLFLPVWEKLLFICENGALVKRGGETLFVDPLSPGWSRGFWTPCGGKTGFSPSSAARRTRTWKTTRNPFSPARGSRTPTVSK